MKFFYCFFIILNSSLFLQAQTSFQYTVKKKDKSLWSICQRFGTSVSKVLALNYKKDAFIHPNDTLQIPLEDDFMVHIVSKKDKSLWGICQQYNVPIQKIKTFNQKEENRIYINETLIIPKKYIPIWNKKEQHLSYSLWKNLQYPTFDFKAQQAKFLYQNKKNFSIPKVLRNNKPNTPPIPPLEYIELYQDRSQGPQDGPTYYKKYTDLYYYSIQPTFFMNEGLDTIIPSKPMPVSAYSFTPLALLEYDSSSSDNVCIRYLLYFDEQIGNLEGKKWEWGISKTGEFACCYHSPVLASYTQTDSSITEVKSELLSPLLIKQTTIHTILKENKVYKTQTQIFILECCPYDSPALMDEAHYEDGQLVEPFSNKNLRRRYNY